MERGNTRTNPLYTVTNCIFFLALVLALCVIDFNLVKYIDLQVRRLELAIERFFFMIRLEWDIFWIKKNKDRYLDMAKEILKDMEVEDEQVQP
jgi:hypothetical protein